ncbi:hypothetical protein MUN88_17195 [Gracilibacillus caseinilyticus]|uniref:DUF4282 domain-containing protein n=1 Tax=Gracilibacillus caseinilyticus TaxID=2932256 RepID=A0ABY4ETM9_9BACI|nr:hypothetical protein [Gracilibacillus caseinilyticus]UOQ47768.1 hypothetical protein MUN88_17195 [Gracilibacillus caseinilyticus]
MKNFLTIGLFGWFLKLVFAEAVVLGIVWLLNATLGLSISIILIGSVVFALFFLELIYSLLVINTGKEIFDDMEKEFDRL